MQLIKRRWESMPSWARIVLKCVAAMLAAYAMTLIYDLISFTLGYDQVLRTWAWLGPILAIVVTYYATKDFIDKWWLDRVEEAVTETAAEIAEAENTGAESLFRQAVWLKTLEHSKAWPKINEGGAGHGSDV